MSAFLFQMMFYYVMVVLKFLNLKILFIKPIIVSDFSVSIFILTHSKAS